MPLIVSSLEVSSTAVVWAHHAKRSLGTVGEEVTTAVKVRQLP